MKKLFWSILLSAGLFAACKKDQGHQGQPLDLTTFKREFSVPAQSFNGVAGTVFSITGKNGIKIDFPANAFVDQAGQPVTGNIRLSLIEILSKKAILLSGKMTESNGQLLVSGGEFQILATQGNTPLKLNPFALVPVQVPTTFSTEPMQLFSFGPAAVSDSTWVLVNQERIPNDGKYYQFNLPEFGWINCDYFYNDPRPKTTVTASPVYTGSVPSVKSQQAYLVFAEINSVAGMPFQPSLNKHQSYVNSMPVGLSGRLVIISVGMDDVIYFGYRDFTVSADLDLNVPMTVTTQQEMDAVLNSL